MGLGPDLIPGELLRGIFTSPQPDGCRGFCPESNGLKLPSCSASPAAAAAGGAGVEGQGASVCPRAENTEGQKVASPRAGSRGRIPGWGWRKPVLDRGPRAGVTPQAGAASAEEEGGCAAAWVVSRGARALWLCCQVRVALGSEQSPPRKRDLCELGGQRTLRWWVWPRPCCLPLLEPSVVAAPVMGAPSAEVPKPKQELDEVISEILPSLGETPEPQDGLDVRCSISAGLWAAGHQGR